MKRRATAEKETPARIALREIHDNVTVTRDTLTAWFVLSPQRWSFLSDVQREQLIINVGRRLVGIAGHRIHLRGTLKPYPAREWAENLYRRHPDALPGLPEYLTSAQLALHKSTLSDKVIFLGVDLKTRGRFDRANSKVAGRSGARSEIEKQDANLRRVAGVIGGAGMDGRPARTDEVEWLIHRSIRLGLPVPSRLSVATDDPWAVEDMHAFTDGVRYTYNRFGPTVQISADYNGQSVTRHVAVLTVGRMSTLDIPQTDRDPWMQHTDMLGFPVEWSSTFDVLAGKEVTKATERKRLVIRDQQKQYRAHGIEQPLDLNDKAEHARVIEHETTHGSRIDSARAYGWHRLAVSGSTQQECLDRVQAVRDAYEADQQIDIQHPSKIKDAGAQFGLYCEFIPGEPVSTTAYRRDLKALHVAAGLPHVSASVGDRRGFYLGYTTSHSRRAFMFDPWYAMEVQEKAGLIPIFGEQGAGKSGVVGGLGRYSALSGATTTLLDPASRLQALCAMPSLRNHSRHLDLVQGIDGSLNTYAVVTEPKREHYESEGKWAEAVQIARQSRKSLTVDILRQLIPPQVDKMRETPLVLQHAVRAVAPERTSSLWDVVHALEHLDRYSDHAHDLAAYLRDMAEMPQARLFFPNNVHDEEEYNDTLLVLTMHGIDLPNEDQPREEWSTSEQLSVPLLHLASYYATRRVYDLPPDERKMLALDELGLLAAWGSGKTLVNQLGRNTRKWNVAVPAASQNPGDILGMNVANFISTTFAGRIEDENIATEALRFLRIKPGIGYESALHNLSPQVALADGNKRRGARDFLVKDVWGNVEKVKIDYSADPELLQALASGSIKIREEAVA